MGSTMSTTAPGQTACVPKQSPRSSRGRRRHRSRSRGRRRQSPLGLFIRGRRGSDDESEDDLSVSSAMSWEATNAPPSPRKPPAPEFGTTLLAHRRPEVYVELTPDLMLYVLGYLDPKARHRAAANPACRQLRDRVTKNREVWAHLCSSTPWRIHRSDLEHRPVNALRRLHRSVVEATDSVDTAPIADIARIMSDHARVAGVQVRCFRTLADRLHCETFRKNALDCGVASSVVRALWKFDECDDVQVVALHCVVFLARPIGGAEGMVYHRGMASRGLDAFLGESGGIAAVLRSMRIHGKNANVQAMGCWSLVNLALNHQQKLALLALDGLDAVLAAMAHHPTTLEVQFRALFALINLVIPEAGSVSTNTMDCGENAAHARVVRGVLAAMRHFPESEKLVRCGCLVLHNLSLDDKNVPHLLAFGVARPLQRAARSHKDADVQRSAVSTLRRLRVAVAPEVDVLQPTLRMDGSR